jgi:hypothetical protein
MRSGRGWTTRTRVSRSRMTESRPEATRRAFDSGAPRGAVAPPFSRRAASPLSRAAPSFASVGLVGSQPLPFASRRVLGGSCRFATSWDQRDVVFRRVMGPPLLQAEETTRGGGVSSFFAASWDPPICRGKGPAVPDPRAVPASSDRAASQGSFRRRRGSPSGGAHVLPGADDDRHQGSAAPLVGAAESSPHRM